MVTRNHEPHESHEPLCVRDKVGRILTSYDTKSDTAPDRRSRPVPHRSNGHQKLDKNLLRDLGFDPAIKQEIAAEEAADDGNRLPRRTLKQEIAAGEREHEKLVKEANEASKRERELDGNRSPRRYHPHQETSTSTPPRGTNQIPRYRVNTVREEWAALKAGRRLWGVKWYEIYLYLPTTLATRVVLMALVLFWNEKGKKSPKAWPGWRTLSQVTGMAQQNISRALKTLVHLGILTVERQRQSVYTFVHPSAFPATTRRQAKQTLVDRCRRIKRTTFRHRQPKSA